MSDEKNSHPGMMGDGTEEQNLGQPGNPEARIKKDEVEQAFKDGDAGAGSKDEPKATTPKDNSHNFQ